MSGSGGYYKYRCKYWLTYNCPNWVWVNNAPCAHCLADGRDSQVVMASGSIHSAHEIYVPYLENGSVHYLARETICASDRMSAWIIKDALPHPLPTIAKPTPLNFMATEEGLQTHSDLTFDF
ncbi:hypothetical protein OIDMADRAFT_122646 [Oidiodendron maius Zn]|uniref:Uncharacterized protein n=1 Tax=Oidiodendron maius (strain Zn) TaxID=913774 RepID=A0A0C3H021_OIDMZ|nr:hypothetical protein OIDMADRAFT_122646 [Oidiodendron maius Zn]